MRSHIGKCCPDTFNKSYHCIKSPQNDFLKFRVKSEGKSGVCSYFRIWLKIAAIIKNAVASSVKETGISVKTQ